MAFDSITLTTVMPELKGLIGARVSRIQQPTRLELILTLRGSNGSSRLLISAHPERARIHITTASPVSPSRPPGFCLYLRRHLEGARLKHIIHPESERIIQLQFTPRDQLGEKEPLLLIAETMGRHSNIIVVNQRQNLILAAIKPITADISRYRQVLPGLPYKSPPPQNKLQLSTLTELQFYSELKRRGRNLTSGLLATIAGLSPLWARELIVRSGLQPTINLKVATPAQLAPLWQEVVALTTTLARAEIEPTVYLQTDGQVLLAAPWPLAYYSGLPTKTFPTMSAALDFYFQAQEKRLRFTALQQSLLTKINRQLKRGQKKLALHSETIHNAGEVERYRKFGELLLAYAYQLKDAGLTEVELQDWADPETRIVIPLNPALTPVENAQYYFARYRKAKKTLVATKRQQQRCREDLSYLESVLLTLEQADRLSELEEIKAELKTEGYIKRGPTPRKQQPKTSPTSKPLFFSVDGYPVLVGKNNRQNENLLHSAQSHDVWLHTQNIPGSHVIIRCPDNKLPPQNVLLPAAHLAAYYSRARSSSNVPVDYTQRKHVNKPAGSRPGFVTYTNQRTLYVTPDLNIIKALKDQP